MQTACPVTRATARAVSTTGELRTTGSWLWESKASRFRLRLSYTDRLAIKMLSREQCVRIFAESPLMSMNWKHRLSILTDMMSRAKAGSQMPSVFICALTVVFFFPHDVLIEYQGSLMQISWAVQILQRQRRCFAKRRVSFFNFVDEFSSDRSQIVNRVERRKSEDGRESCRFLAIRTSSRHCKTSPTG